MKYFSTIRALTPFKQKILEKSTKNEAQDFYFTVTQFILAINPPIHLNRKLCQFHFLCIPQEVKIVELSCCKRSPNKETVLGNRGHMRVLNDTKLILNDQRGHSCSLRTNLVLFGTFRRPLFPNQFLGWALVRWIFSLF